MQLFYVQCTIFNPLPCLHTVSTKAFDDIKPLALLDNTIAKDKSQVALRNARRPRNKPSREHIRSMSAENLLSGLDELSPDASPTEKTPVPRPRRPTMEKEEKSPLHKPLPTPRNPRSPVPPHHNEPRQKPPKPDSERVTPGGSPERKARTGRLSPPLTRAPSPNKPSSAKNGLPPRPVPRRPNKREDAAPVATGGGGGGGGGGEDQLETRDPSQLTVKERMELAQRAMARRPPPPVLHKKPPPATRSSVQVEGDLSGPKSLSQPEGEEAELLPGARLPYDSGQSPRPAKKLPPGAFNMGLMIPFGGGGGGGRQRSNTVGTSSREHSMERETGEQYAEQIVREEDVGSSREALDTDDIDIKLPPKRPPLPLNRRTASNEKPAQLSSRNDEALSEATPPSGLAANSSEGLAAEEPDGGSSSGSGAGGGGGMVDEEHGILPDPSDLDYSQVLTWSPAQVASWLTKIGAGQHTKGFLDRGVQGNKLFDMDGSGLKVGAV